MIPYYIDILFFSIGGENVKIRYTTILPEDILNQTKEKAKKEGCGGNAIIEKALRLYFSSHLPNEVWEKTLESGWIKKVVLLDDGILFENIKCRRTITNYKKEEYTQEALKSRGWKKV